jgi:hypothetical protein
MKQLGRFTRELSLHTILLVLSTAISSSFWGGKSVSTLLLRNSLIPRPAREEMLSPSPSSSRPGPVQETLNWKAIETDAEALTSSENVIALELLVHPTLLAHLDPRDVAIVTSTSSSNGNNGNGLLDQVLKHKSVQDITVFADENALLLGDENNHTCRVSEASSSEHSPTISTSIEWIFDGTVETNQTFDVVILNDALRTPPVVWYEHLIHEGILIARLNGPTPSDRFNQIRQLADAGFAKVIDYELWVAGHDKFYYYAVAFKKPETRARWHFNQAHWNLKIHQRLSSQASSLEFFDSTTMTLLEYPSKTGERDFCREYPESCEDPHGFDPEIPNLPKEQIEVSKSGVGEHAGRGVFSKDDFLAGSYIDLATAVHPIRCHWRPFQIFEDLLDKNPIFDKGPGAILSYYFDGYGFIDEPWVSLIVAAAIFSAYRILLYAHYLIMPLALFLKGVAESTVDSGIMTFSNHGCNGTSNLGILSELHELIVDPEVCPDVFQHFLSGPYNPLVERNLFVNLIATMSSKDVKAGEELLDNYLSFGGAEYFKENVLGLRQQCAGTAVGEVEEYQNEHIKGGAKNASKAGSAAVHHPLPNMPLIENLPLEAASIST